MSKNVNLHLIVLAFVAMGEWIGAKQFDIGVGTIALFPMLYVLVWGGIVSWPKFRLLSEKQMKSAAAILGISFMLFVAKLVQEKKRIWQNMFNRWLPNILMIPIFSLWTAEHASSQTLFVIEKQCDFPTRFAWRKRKIWHFKI